MIKVRKVLGSEGPEGSGSAGSEFSTFAVLCCALVLSAGPLTDPRTLGPSRTNPVLRIISLVPAVTEMLFAIGAGDQVVGVSSYEIYPPEAKKRPSMGALFDPDVERILAAKSDLVIVYGSQTELMSRLQRASVPMFRYEHAGLADITSTIRAFGDRVGRGARAKEVAAAIERDLTRFVRAWPESRVQRLRCSSAASQARCATCTRVAASASCTTCSNWPAALTPSPT